MASLIFFLTLYQESWLLPSRSRGRPGTGVPGLQMLFVSDVHPVASPEFSLSRQCNALRNRCMWCRIPRPSSFRFVSCLLDGRQLVVRLVVCADVSRLIDSSKEFWEFRHIGQAYGDWSSCLGGDVLRRDCAIIIRRGAVKREGGHNVNSQP